MEQLIEVDGITHMWDETTERDRVKDELLTEAGFTVMRFSDEEVLKDMHGVIQRIEYWIEVQEEALGLPAREPTSPLPPSKGG